MEPTVNQIISGLVLAALIAFIGLVLSQKSQLVRIETILTGANGDNGLVGDVKALRTRTHDLANGVNALGGTLTIHAMRLDEWDRRDGPDDRRVRA